VVSSRELVKGREEERRVMRKREAEKRLADPGRGGVCTVPAKPGGVNSAG